MAKSTFNRLLTRRSVLKGASGLAAAAVLGGCSKDQNENYYVTNPIIEDPSYLNEQIFNCACRSNCQSNCNIIAHKRNGRVVKTAMGSFIGTDQKVINPDATNSTRVVDAETAQGSYTDYNRVCLRGLAHVQRLYSQSRILYPMMQMKERGDITGFERITWEKALSEIVKNIKENYKPQNIGNEGRDICVFSMSGNYGAVHGGGGAPDMMARALNASKVWTSLDMSLPVGLSKVMGPYATFPFITGNELRDIKNANTLILWGSNMAEAHLMGWGFVQDGRVANGGKIKNLISIDVMANTTNAKSDYFYAIRPGSDTMLALSMINKILTDGNEDPEYLFNNTVAPFLVYESSPGVYNYVRRAHFTGDPAHTEYVALSNTDTPVFTTNQPGTLGDKMELPGVYTDYDMYNSHVISAGASAAGLVTYPTLMLLKNAVAPYDPVSAEKYTNVSPTNLTKLVDMYLEAESTIYLGFGTSHHYNSHYFGHAVATLGAITGNIGRKGRSIGNFFSRTSSGIRRTILGSTDMYRTTTPSYLMGPKFAEDLRNGTSTIKMLMVSNGNPVSNYVNAKKDYIDTIFHKDYMPFIVTQDFEFTDTARHSDIVLPAAHWFEVEDVLMGSKYPFAVYQEKIVEPLGEVISDMGVARLLTERLIDENLEPFSSRITPHIYKEGNRNKGFKTDWDFIAACLTPDPTSAPSPTVTEYNLKQQKNVRIQPDDKIFVSLENLAPSGPEDIVRASGCVSGRLEFFCEDPKVFIRKPFVEWVETASATFAGIGIENEQFPTWVAPKESWDGEGMDQAQRDLVAKYPLIYMQEHTKWRVHTQWTEVPWLRELDPEPILKISPNDAAKYGNIQTGDVVKISNDRGSAVFRAIITAALPDGMINVPKGWERYKNVEAFGIEGGYNDLSSPEWNQIGCDGIFYDARVKIEKI